MIIKDNFCQFSIKAKERLYGLYIFCTYARERINHTFFLRPSHLSRQVEHLSQLKP